MKFHIATMLVLAQFAVAPLSAQRSPPNIELCTHEGEVGVIIGACSALIDTGLLNADLRAKILTRRGKAYYMMGDFKAALDDFSLAMELTPNDAAAHRYVGDARSNLLRGDKDFLAVTEQLEKAIGEYNRAAQLDPKDVETLIHRGTTFAGLGRLERGLDDLNQAVALEPDSPVALEARGRILLAGGAYPRAIADFTEALRLLPGFLNALLNRGIAYDRMEDYEHAVADFDEVIRQNPSATGAYNNRGMSYAKWGRTDEAIESFNKALLLDPNLAGAYFNRGQAYYLKGDKSRALSDYVQARQLDQQFPEPPLELWEDYNIDLPGDYRPRRPFSD